jgi:enoyl-CoA hydratase/carnithine racemase
MPVHYTVRDSIGIITLDNPPVNSFDIVTRRALAHRLEEGIVTENIRALIITGAGRCFSAGADISEFGQQSLAEPNLPTLIDLIDGSPKPVIAAINGTALGGGCELALACHYRVGAPKVSIGLPEVTLGILAGAGGTQRLPRLIGVPAALDMIMTGQVRASDDLARLGFFDAMFEHDLIDNAITFANTRMQRGVQHPRLSDRRIAPQSLPAGAAAFFTQARAMLAQRPPEGPAPMKCLEAVEAAVYRPFSEGRALEFALVKELLHSAESKALCHLFFAERSAAKGIAPAGTPIQKLQRIGYIGGNQRWLDLLVRTGYALESLDERCADEDALAKVLGELDMVVEIMDANDLTKVTIGQRLARLNTSKRTIVSTAPPGHLAAIAAIGSNSDCIVAMHCVGNGTVIEVAHLPGTAATALMMIQTLTRAAGAFCVSVNSPDWIATRIQQALLRAMKALHARGVTQEAVRNALISWGFTALLEDDVLPATQDNFSAAQVIEHCIAELEREAVALMQENSVGRPSDIDVISVAALGFPRFRGGLLYHTEHLHKPNTSAEYYPPRSGL